MKVRKIANWVLFILPVSLLLTRFRLPGVHLYFSELLACGYIGLVLFDEPLSEWRRVVQRLPGWLKLSLLLLGLGIGMGIVFSPDWLRALNLAKSWFFLPALLALAMIVEKPVLHYFYAGLAALGVIETLWAFKQLLNGAEALHGSLPSASYYAALIAPILVLTFLLGRKEKWWWAVSLFLMVGLLLGHSLGGVLGVVAGGSWLIWKEKHHNWLVIGPFLLLSLGLVGITVKRDMTNLATSQLVQTWQTGRVAGYLAELVPFSGVGLNGFNAAYQPLIHQWYLHPYEQTADQPSNLELALITSLGIFGFLGFTGLIARLLAISRLSPAQVAFVALLGAGLLSAAVLRIEIAFIFWPLVALVLLQTDL